MNWNERATLNVICIHVLDSKNALHNRHYFIIVTDLPTNVSIEMIGEAVNGEAHNLTCRVTNSLPPPSITWLVNGVDMTSNAVTENTTLTPDGRYSTELNIRN